MKRNKFYITVELALSLFVLASCENKPKDGRTDTYSSGVVEIASDESFSPIIQQEIDVFENVYKNASIIPIFTDEVNAINLLLKDSVRLAIVTRTYTKKELEAFHSKNFAPTFIHVATDGLALIVNKNNKDTLITTNDFRRILRGEATKWRDIYPHSSNKDDIVLVFDNPNSSNVRFAIDSINYGKPLSTKNIRAMRKNEEVINYVAKTPNAIGVIGVNWLEDKSDTTNLTYINRIKVMSVSGASIATPANSYKPYQAYLFKNEYPLCRPIYLLLNDPRNGLSWGFAQFMASDKGQRIILKSGLLPTTMMQMIRLVDVKDEY